MYREFGIWECDFGTKLNRNWDEAQNIEFLNKYSSKFEIWEYDFRIKIT